MVVDYEVVDLKDAVRHSMPEEKAAILELSEGSKVILEFEDNSCKTLEVYGKLSRSVEQRFSAYAKKYSNCFGSVPVEDVSSLLNDTKTYKVVTM